MVDAARTAAARDDEDDDSGEAAAAAAVASSPDDGTTRARSLEFAEFRAWALALAWSGRCDALWAMLRGVGFNGRLELVGGGGLA